MGNILSALALSVAPGLAVAAPISLFDTGVDALGNVRANGAVEQHYQLISAPLGAGPLHVQTQGYPISVWAAAPAGSAWITPDGINGLTPYGSYDIRLTFDLTGLDAAGAVITGMYAADDTTTAILLNGAAVSASPANLHSLTSFTIGSGFRNGLNTIDFDVENTGPALSAAPSPSGLLVQLSGDAPVGFITSGAPPAVPEPGSLALVASAVIGLAFAATRHSRTALGQA